MATHRRQPPPRLASQKTASSKSRASSPSMVTSGRARRSIRPSLAFSGTCSPRPATSLVTSSGQVCGMPWVRRAISISMPGAMFSPSTSSTVPTELVRPLERWLMRTTTTWLWRAPLFSPSGMMMSWPMRLSSGTTKPTPFSTK
ncbi:hypothetical protein D3C85_1066660 [compost metagenome]